MEYLEIAGRVRACITGRIADSDAPLNDWLNVRRIVTKYIVFDNVDRQHPSVSLAVIQAMRSWKLVELENGQAVLENV